MELEKELKMVEIVSASDALNNARTVLEEHMPEDEQWADAVRRFVFPLLADEHDRLACEHVRLLS